MTHADEMRRCLAELDVQGVRSLWQHIAPHLPQPSSDEQALEILHRARLEAKSVSQAAKDYSREWLADRERRTIAAAVGISVGAPVSRRFLAEDMRGEMEYAVTGAVSDGLDLKAEAPEVTRRMNVAKTKAVRRLYAVQYASR